MMNKEQRAKDAINAVYGDTSVSIDETVGRLERLREEIDMILSALTEDLQ